LRDICTIKGNYWFGIAAIIGISIGITFYAPISEAYKGIAVLPSVGGLAAALFQLIRDRSAHQRKLELSGQAYCRIRFDRLGPDGRLQAS